MAVLATIKIDLNKLDKSRIFEGRNGAKYYDLQVAINDETGQYGDNISVSDSQTKEERESKKKKNYVGNGQVKWTNGQVSVAGGVSIQSNNTQQYNNNNAPQSNQDEPDLPF